MSLCLIYKLKGKCIYRQQRTETIIYNKTLKKENNCMDSFLNLNLLQAVYKTKV